MKKKITITAPSVGADSTVTQIVEIMIDSAKTLIDSIVDPILRIRNTINTSIDVMGATYAATNAASKVAPPAARAKLKREAEQVRSRKDKFTSIGAHLEKICNGIDAEISIIKEYSASVSKHSTEWVENSINRSLELIQDIVDSAVEWANRQIGLLQKAINKTIEAVAKKAAEKEAEKYLISYKASLARQENEIKQNTTIEATINGAPLKP